MTVIDSVDRLLSSDLLDIALKVPIQTVRYRALDNAGIELVVRRDDLIDPQLSGNKFYKLFFNLADAHTQGFRQLLSFGGAYSNHLYALAAAGRRYGFRTLGVVRGERPAQLSPTLCDVEAWGMQLIFISRGDYRNKNEPELITDLKARYGDFFLVPEGGGNLAGARGMQVMGRALEAQLKGDYTAIGIASGTGTSVAGLAAGLSPSKRALGFSVLKGQGDLESVVGSTFRALRPGVDANWGVVHGYHAGGYGKPHPEYLTQFWREFEHETGIRLDPVYTVKLLWGIVSLAQQGYWPRGSRIVAIHSGGLQGRRGFICP